MADELTRFEDDGLLVGIQVDSRDMSPRFEMDESSTNMTMGIEKGLGPRYGTAPLPGHCSTEDNAATGPIGLRQCETATAPYSYADRLRVYACFPVSENFPNTGTTGPKTYYVWVVGSSHGGVDRVDFVISAAQSGVNTYPEPDFAAGLNYAIKAGITNAPNMGEIAYLNLAVNTTDMEVFLATLFSGYSKNYMSSAQLSVTGTDVPMNWIFYTVISNGSGTGSATKTAIGNFNGFNSGGTILPYGMPSSINLNNYSTSARSLSFYNLTFDTTGAPSYGTELGYAYYYNTTQVTSGTYLQGNDDICGVAIGTENNSIDLSTITFSSQKKRDDGIVPASYQAASSQGVLMNDPSLTTNTSYQAFFMAADKPLCVIMQGWNRSRFGYPFRFFDLRNNRYTPVTTTTLDYLVAGNATPYTEGGHQIATCWAWWPTFDPNSALAKNSAGNRSQLTSGPGASPITLGAAGSGVLRANTIYEFAYSVYDKTLGIETNVGDPAKIKTDTDDFVAISIYRDIYTGASSFYQQACFGNIFRGPFKIFDTIPGFGVHYYPLNTLEWRVYYRALGSYEWLPAAAFDASYYQYYPNQQITWMCQTPIAALPGGQPGGFNDYSTLPSDTYFDVKVFQGRTFWCSQKNVVFSYKNNPFAYAGRNSIACPTGEFKGMLIHMFFGQSEQTGRIVIFGSKETYAGRFTGEPSLSPIQIDPNTIGNYPLDGSDFIVESRTTVTAFSYRSAVVAEGELYWWGPTGIYHDDGVNVPKKISDRLEPLIFSLYDTNSTDEINCEYSYQTKEIVWFYTAKGDTSGKTSMLIYNIKENAFYPGNTNFKVDGSQQISIGNGTTNLDTGGQRTLIFARKTASDTIQRAYFFDQFNRSGDMYPTTEFMVKTVSAIVNGQMTLTLASGFDATAFAAINVGDKFCLSQVTSYSAQSAATTQDFIGVVVSKSAPNIVISVPSSVSSYFSGTLTSKRFFPIYNSVQNAITYLMESKIWTPGGMKFWAYWLFCHLFFKVKLLASAAALTLDFSYRTPVSGPYQTNTITLVDNSLGNCQIYTSLKNIKRTHDGQGVKLKISGAHFGSPWVLQYIAMDANAQIYDELKEFQG